MLHWLLLISVYYFKSYWFSFFSQISLRWLIQSMKINVNNMKGECNPWPLCCRLITSENRRARCKSCFLTLLGFSIPLALLAFLVLGTMSKELLEVALGREGTETLSLYVVSVDFFAFLLGFYTKTPSRLPKATLVSHRLQCWEWLTPCLGSSSFTSVVDSSSSPSFCLLSHAFSSGKFQVSPVSLKVSLFFFF